MTERRHKHGFQLVVNGQRTNIELDGLTLAFVPAGVALREYALKAIEALGAELLGSERDAGEVIRTISACYSCSAAQVAKTAVARYRPS